MERQKLITRNVWILSVVSLCTDVSSEMLYPVIPVYLKHIGFSIILIGMLEGVAEATAGLSKGYFGNLSDTSGKRMPFVQLGYTFSALSKPLMVIWVYPAWVFFARTLDKLGKGLRTGARDALLSDEATPETKGRVFGFHRAMDTLGAVIGPSIALLYLAYHPENYKTLFFVAFAPGLAAIAFTFLIKEKPFTGIVKPKPRFLDFIQYWKNSKSEYKKLVGALLVFTLFNSSDVFLLLKIKEAGYTDAVVIGAFIFYNLIYALFSYPLGVIADRIGMKKIFITGLVLFSIVYSGMAMAHNEYLFFALFFLYGVYSAATEGIAKAWISNISLKENTATAIGTYTAFQSICSLVASSMAGIIWFSAGASFTFFLTAAVSLGVAVFISRIRQKS